MNNNYYVTTRFSLRIPPEQLRTIAEMFIPAIPKITGIPFTKNECYEIFFPRLPRRKYRRIRVFRNMIIFAIRQTFGMRADIHDLQYILRYPNINTAGCSISNAKRRYSASTKEAIMRQMRMIQKQCNLTELVPPGLVKVSAQINGESWSYLVPQQCLDYATTIKATICKTLDREHREVFGSSRKRELVQARAIFIYLFLRKFPDATEKLLTYLLNKTNHTTIIHVLKKISAMADSRHQDYYVVKEFWGLVEQVRKNLPKNPDRPAS